MDHGVEMKVGAWSDIRILVGERVQMLLGERSEKVKMAGVWSANKAPQAS